LTLALVADSGQIAVAKLPPPISERGSFDVNCYSNPFWQLSSNWRSYSSLTDTLPLRIDFHSMGFMEPQVYASMSAGFERQAADKGGAAAAEIDELKRMFME